MFFFDRLPRKLRAKIDSFEETDSFRLGFPDLTPFRLRDIADVEWDGYRGSDSEGAPRELP